MAAWREAAALHQPRRPGGHQSHHAPPQGSHEDHAAAVAGADEFGDGDPTIISNCWLYVADTDDSATARAMTREGQAVLVASYEKIGPHGDGTP